MVINTCSAWTSDHTQNHRLGHSCAGVLGRWDPTELYQRTGGDLLAQQETRPNRKHPVWPAPPAATSLVKAMGPPHQEPTEKWTDPESREGTSQHIQSTLVAPRTKHKDEGRVSCTATQQRARTALSSTQNRKEAAETTGRSPEPYHTLQLFGLVCLAKASLTIKHFAEPCWGIFNF